MFAIFTDIRIWYIDIYPPQVMYIKVCGNLVHNSQKLKLARMSSSA